MPEAHVGDLPLHPATLSGLIVITMLSKDAGLDLGFLHHVRVAALFLGPDKPLASK